MRATSGAGSRWTDPGPSSPAAEHDEEITYTIRPDELLALADTSRLTVQIGEVSITSSDRRVFQALLDFASRLKPGQQ